MRDDWPKPRKLQLVEGLVHRRRNGKVRELHEQIAFLIECETRRVAPNLLEIFKAEMEIAASCESEAAFEARLNFIPAHFYQFGNELVIRTGVWSSNYMGNTVLDGHFGHGERHIDRLCAVIEA